MATSKPVVKIPPIVSIEPRGDGRYGQPGAFSEADNSRVFGLFLDIRSNGTFRGAVEIAGNIAPFQTCCGGLRASALRVDYRHFDSWYPQGMMIQTNHPTDEASWAYARTHLSEFPSIKQWAGTDDAGDWSTDQIKEWARAVLCAHVKVTMQNWRRTTLVCLDRGGGHTLQTLGSLKHIDKVHYPYMMAAQVFSRDGRRLSSNPMATSVMSFRRSLINDPSPTFQEMRAYGAAMTQNINSGNMLWPITVVPKMSPAAQKRASARLIRSPSPNTMEFVRYFRSAELDPLLNFYSSPLFHRLAPSSLSHA